MKTIATFTQLEHTFTVKVNTLKTNSNYNIFAHVQHKGDKTAFIGTSFKDGTQNETIIKWAKEAVGREQTNEFVDMLFKETK